MRLLRAEIAAAVALLAAAGAAVPAVAGGPVGAIAVFATGAGVAAALGLVIALRTGRAAESLAAAARGIAGGDLGARVDSRATGDLAETVDAFNRMASAVAAQLDASSQERARLVVALDSSVDAVMAVDAVGRVAFASLAAERLFAKSRDEIVGNPFAWLISDVNVLQALRAGKDHGPPAIHHVDQPGRRFLRVVTAPITGGGDWSALAVIHDLTDARRLELVRRDFVANVSHELRTPLAAIKSVIETLERGAMGDPAVAADFLARANSEVDRLAQMVEDLLELSRIESGDVPLALASLDINAIASSSVNRMKPLVEKPGLHVELETAPGLPVVIGDAARIERAIMNLIHNAVKFTPNGGVIRVSAGHEGGEVVVKVSDPGEGIAPEDLPRVFERFYKARRPREGGGSGLGLAVVKHTAEAHGGRVSVESEPGKGSTFTIFLPAADSPG